ncbi:MAG TPA: ssl1498 family light-harvesting-like protein [Stenomitos sp.]
MYTTQDEHGILNNFAAEPKVYFAEQPSVEQQKRYWIQGVLALSFVSGLIGLAFVVS